MDVVVDVADVVDGMRAEDYCAPVCYFCGRHGVGIQLQRSAICTRSVMTVVVDDVVGERVRGRADVVAVLWIPCPAMFVARPHVRNGCVRWWVPDLLCAQREKTKNQRGKEKELLTCMNVGSVISMYVLD